MSWLPIIGGLASAWAGYKGAKAQADANTQNYELQKEQYDYNKAIQKPIVEGAGQLIDTYGSENDPFVSYVQKTGAGSDIAQDVAGSYLSNTQPYQQAGAEGVSGLRNLAGTASAAHTLDQAKAFQNPFTDATYGRGVRDINRASDDSRRQAAITAAGRGSALSGQAARIAGNIEGERFEQIGDLATKVGSQGYQQSLDQARQQQLQQQGLATQLVGLGGQGLDQATSAQNLLAGAGEAGVGAGFNPLKQYQSTIAGTQAYGAPQIEASTNPLGAAIGAGLAGYQSFTGG